jgi:hypothetical protein
VSDLLPARIERVFAVGPAGDVSIEKPKEKPEEKKLSDGQRHQAWRIGLQAVNKFMEERGFESNLGYSSTHMGWQKGHFSINVSLREPGNVAYITSRPGVNPLAPREVIGRDITGAEMFGVTATVTTLKQMLGDAKYVLMVDVSHTNGGTRPPVYIPLPTEGDKPAHYVYRNVLGVIAMMCNSVPNLREAFEVKTVLTAQERPIEELLP